MFSAIRSYRGRSALQDYLNKQDVPTQQLIQRKFFDDFSTAVFIEKIHINLADQSITFLNQKINHISFYVSDFDGVGLAILELADGQEQKLFLKQKEFTPLLISCGATKESLIGQKGKTTAQKEWDHLSIYHRYNKNLEELYESLHQLLATELAKILAHVAQDKTIQLVVPGCGFAKEAIACYTTAKKTHKWVKVFAFDFSTDNVNDAKQLVAKLLPPDQQEFLIMQGDSYHMQQTLKALRFDNRNILNVMVISGGFNTLVLEPEIDHISVAMKAMYAFFQHDIHYILGTGRTSLLINSNHTRCGFALEDHFQIYKLIYAEQFYFHRFRKLRVQEQLSLLIVKEGQLDLSLCVNPLVLLTGLFEDKRKQIEVIDLSHANINADEADELARLLNKFPCLKMVILDCYTNRWLVSDLQEKNWANRPLIVMHKPELSNLKLAFSMQQIKSYFDIDHLSKLNEQTIIFPNVSVFKHFERLCLEFAKQYPKSWFKLIVDNNNLIFSMNIPFSLKQLSAIEHEADLFQIKNRECLVEIIKETGEIILKERTNDDDRVFRNFRFYREKLSLIDLFFHQLLPYMQVNNSSELNENFMEMLDDLRDKFFYGSEMKHEKYYREFSHPVIEQMEQLQLSLLHTFMVDGSYQNAVVYVENIAALLQTETTLNTNELEQLQNKLKQFGAILTGSTMQQIEHENNNDNCNNNAYGGIIFSHM